MVASVLTSQPILWLSIANIVLLLVIAIIALFFMQNLRDKLSKFDGGANLQQQHNQQMLQAIFELRERLQQTLQVFKEQSQQELQQYRAEIEKRQLEGLKIVQDSIQSNLQEVRAQIVFLLTNSSEQLSKQVGLLLEQTQIRLQEISGQVDKRLTEGFEKTTATFADVLKRLALIDEAQKRITELSSNVINLQEILADKRARGAFGEVQLNHLIQNLLPRVNFSLQHTLSNSKRVDCLLLLPDPTGNIAIDAKFPLESYRKLTNQQLTEPERRQLEQQFRQDVRKHIQDIADKYIIRGETADGAIMFIPAEAIFAEIHAYYPEIVEEAQNRRVWLTSPTTMMAILTTARSMLKDADTRKQVHVIQEHLIYLAKDFERFHKRMENLAKHIHQANEDVKDVHASARKITSRFSKIEKVELEIDELPDLPVESLPQDVS